MPGRRKLLPLQAALGLFALVASTGCSRSAAPKAAAERPAPSASVPAGSDRAKSVEESDARAQGSAEGATAPGDDSISDHAEEEKLPKKKADAGAEEPSLSQPPAVGGPLPSDDDQLEQLGREERQFQQALDPEALSCAGALPRRDAICSLSEKICELSPPTYSLSAQEDCDKARSACTQAKAAYHKRCGG